MSDTADTIERPLPTARPVRRAFGLSTAEPMAPEATAEQIADTPETDTPAAAPAAAAPVVAVPPAAASAAEAPAPAVSRLRRPSPSLATAGEPMSPDATPAQISAVPDEDHVPAAPEPSAAPAATAAATAPAAPSDAAQAISPPQAPQNPDTGAFIATDSMRARSHGVTSPDAASDVADPDAPVLSGGDEAAAVPPAADGKASAPPAPPEAALDPDTFVPPEPLDVLNQWIVGSLAAMRADKRAELGDEIMEVAVRHHAAETELARLRAAAAQELDIKNRGKMAAAAAAAAGGPGGAGGPGILSGLGNLIGGVGTGIAAVGGAVARSIGNSPEKVAANAVGDTARELNALRMKRKLALDHRMPRTIEAANNMYQAHKLLADRVQAFNHDFGATPQGQEYLTRLQSTADAKGITTRELRDQIHEGRIGDPETAALAKQTSDLAANPIVSARLREIEQLSTTVRVNADRMEKGLGRARDDGMDLESLDGKFADGIKGMDVDDCALSRPGEQPLHKLSERMKEMSEKLLQALRDLIQNLKSMFTGGSKSPS